jgi:EAL domain-containing protein (putative c-di-GMP-specific phosphodiesterase class I)
MEKLRNAGVQFYIDDFGTGYSSLTYLQRFSYDTLKIDRSFINEMEQSNGNSAIVEATIALGHMLGMNVIAEGVESEAQLDTLRALNCPEAQGFWFSKPLANWEVNDLLFEDREQRRGH